nr:type I restriction enzyme endonuclease domain-containing protein [Tautonia rosea]
MRSNERTNIVQSRKFREAFDEALLRYTNKAITPAEKISELLDLAKWVREAQKHGEELGLSAEETAFIDALTENGSAQEVLKSETFRHKARELAEMVKLDWRQRESVRADLRRKVRHLLALYGYPPDFSEDATQLFLKQAELSTTNGQSPRIAYWESIIDLVEVQWSRLDSTTSYPFDLPETSRFAVKAIHR